MANLAAASKRVNPFPSGTIVAGLGFLISGIAAYGFLSLASHHLPAATYAPLAIFWALLWILAPGFFYPLEQEIGRATAARKAQGQGIRPVVFRAATIAGILLVVLLAIIAVFSHYLANELFNGKISLVIALGVTLFAYACEFIIRGLLAGNGMFSRYSLLISIEGIFRIFPCVILVAVGLATAGALGFVLGLAALMASILSPLGSKDLFRDGPPAQYSELTNALGFLLIASVCNQFLTYAGAVAVRLLATGSQHNEAGIFLNALVIARIPLFLFQAIQAALLPQLSRMIAQRQFDAYRRAFWRLFLVVIVLGAGATLGMLWLGPFFVHLFFGANGLGVTHHEIGLLALASALIMIGLTLSQSLLSLGHYFYAALMWAAGSLAFVAMLALFPSLGLFVRVDLALAAGCLVTAIVGCAAYLPQLGRLETRAEQFLKLHPAPGGPAQIEGEI